LVVPNDPSVSSHHAVILFRNNKFYIQDKLSTNGTKLNGTELEPDVSMAFGDKAEIHLGDTVLYFRTAQ
jgi:pSer/pThr/pTyr-binding forkhead associated (FHA) protein